jgi:hypothetical protein
MIVTRANMRPVFLTAVVVLLAWSILDFLMHGIILHNAYASTPGLWRPQAEIKMGVLYFAVFGAALAFTAIWGFFVRPKSTSAGLLYGIWFGLGAGISMGFGTYSVMPIPYAMAITWFLGRMVEGVVGGLIVAGMIQE